MFWWLGRNRFFGLWGGVGVFGIRLKVCLGRLEKIRRLGSGMFLRKTNSGAKDNLNTGDIDI